MFAATEETTSGRLRLTGELAGRVPFPVIVINDSPIKLSFESERGIGPAAVDGFFRATNTFIAGKTFAVVGYGWCGRSLARTLRAMGAVVLVVELDPVRALEAAYEGMLVTTIEKAAARADTIITVTGRPGILRREHLALLKDGAMLGNMGHFSTEIDIAGLRELASGSQRSTRTWRRSTSRAAGASTSSRAARCSTSPRRPATRSRSWTSASRSRRTRCGSSPRTPRITRPATSRCPST